MEGLFRLKGNGVIFPVCTETALTSNDKTRVLIPMTPDYFCNIGPDRNYVSLLGLDPSLEVVIAITSEGSSDTNPDLAGRADYVSTPSSIEDNIRNGKYLFYAPEVAA